MDSSAQVQPSMPEAPAKRLIVGITGASGAIYGLRLLQAMTAVPGWRTDLIISQSAAITIQQELGASRTDLERLAHCVHHPRDIGASISSGSFPSAGMVIAPCSMRTLASIATGISDSLIPRAADVILKERRRLVLLARETPLNLVHLRNMVSVTEMGAIVCPPTPAFYNRPATIDDLVNHTVGRILDLFDIPHEDLLHRWQGLSTTTP